MVVHTRWAEQPASGSLARGGVGADVVEDDLRTIGGCVEVSCFSANGVCMLRVWRLYYEVWSFSVEDASGI